MSKRQIDVTEHLLPHQKDEFLNIIKGTSKFYTILANRRHGKSVLLQAICLYVLLSGRGDNLFLSEPTVFQAKAFYKALKKTAQSMHVPFKFRDSSPYEISYKNNTILVTTSNTEPKVGPAYRWLIFDEAFSITQEFLDYMLPTTSTFADSKVVLVSTPRLKSGVFYDYFSFGDEGKDDYYYSVNWVKKYSGKPFYDNMISKDDLEHLRQTMLPVRFASEYLGEWQSASGTVFGDVSKFISTEHGIPYLISIDPSQCKDHDYCTCICSDKKGNFFAPAALNTGGPDACIAFIIDYIHKFPSVSVIVVEENSIGAYVIAYLKKHIVRPGRIVTQVWSGSTKNKSIEALYAGMRTGEVHIPNDAMVIEHLVNVEKHETSSGSYSYGAPSPSHDDFCSALAHGRDVLYSKTFTVPC